MFPIKNKIAIYIGAGASYGHSENPKLCPPLGKDLGEILRKNYQEFREIEEKWGKCGNRFEEWFIRIELSKDIESFTDVLYCLSHYFSENYSKIFHDSLYIKLLQRLNAQLLKNIFFVSLNYESLLELALYDQGYTIDYPFVKPYLVSPIRGVSIPILKPHGSANFRVYLENVKLVNCKRTVLLNAKSKFQSHTVPMHPTEVGKDFIKYPRMPSIISTYSPSKSSCFNPELIEFIRMKIQKNLEQSYKVLIVGIAFNKNDKHILENFKIALRGGSSFAYVGDNTSCSNFRKYLKCAQAQFEYLGSSFAGSFEKCIKFLKG